MRCLGIDPGKTETGWATYSHSRRLERTGVLEGIERVSDFCLAQQYQQWIRLLRVYRPDCVAIERYHAQIGRGTKSNLESLNLTIGLLIAICMRKKIPYVLVTASTHKRWLSSNYEVGLVKAPPARRGRRRTRRSRITKKYEIATYVEWRHLRTEHEVDASNVAKWAITKHFSKPMKR